MCQEANERDILEAYWEASVEMSDEAPAEPVMQEEEYESFIEEELIEDCPSCWGLGYSIWTKEICIQCGGKGR